MLKCESTLNTMNRLLLFVSRQLCDFSICKRGTHTQFLEKYLNFSLKKPVPCPLDIHSSLSLGVPPLYVIEIHLRTI